MATACVAADVGIRSLDLGVWGPGAVAVATEVAEDHFNSHPCNSFSHGYDSKNS